jgi:hypothetical protein
LRAAGARRPGQHRGAGIAAKSARGYACEVALSKTNAHIAPDG